jgi:HlyD family secretion protein
MKIPSFFRNKYFLTGVVVLLAVLAFWFRSNSNTGQKVAVKIGSVVQQVAVTGKAKPSEEADLGFDKSGRVARVYADVGEHVFAGQTIAELESGEASADLLKARASLNEEIVKLEEVKRNAPVEKKNAEEGLYQSLRDAFSVSDDSVRNKADQFFKTPTDNPKFEVSFTDGNFIHYFSVKSDTSIELGNLRKEIETLLNDWQTELSSMNSGNADSYTEKTLARLNKISSFLDKMALAVNSFTPADFAYDSTVSGYKTTINTARTNVVGAASSVVSAKSKLNSAPSSSLAGSFDAVLTQEAKVSGAKAAVASLEAALGKSVIRAPFDGVISKQDAKVGEAVSASSPVASIISLNKMYIEANVSEVNIGKIQLGNPVSIEFDAFPGVFYKGSVYYIEPAETIVDNVVNYKIRVEVQNQDEKIKSGLSANLKIETARKDGVLTVPYYTVSENNNEDFVTVLDGNKKTERKVQIGLIGGTAEVLNGLNEGDLVSY